MNKIFENLIGYPLTYKRRETRSVKIKDFIIGSKGNVVIQSMLTSHTWESEKCLAEIKSLVAVGCQMVRLSVLSNRDLDSMPNLIRLLKDEGINVPLVADVHFAAHLANSACEFFDKVRINPGNFSDRPKNIQLTKKTEISFSEGKSRLIEKAKTLAEQLKKYNRVLRIGVNHGSLSQRMIEAYGDSPLGMVESALEAVNIFQELGFFDIVVSLKSSNPLIANKAYRLFAERNTGANAVPLHLGVTEAGNDSIARVKSISGIGQLLADGIGDTIRISLTEPSANEVVFAKELMSYLNSHKASNKNNNNLSIPLEQYRFSNPEIKIASQKIGLGSSVKVAVASAYPFLADFTYLDKGNSYDFKDGENWVNILKSELEIVEFNDDFYKLRKAYSENSIKKPVAFILPKEINQGDFSLEINLAAAISEGAIDLLLLPNVKSELKLRYSEILQALRIKLFETDYVSCPSCGRTMFDLNLVTNQIKKRTKHLSGVKIGILGCIVNGPGEMADSDFGYVGSAAGFVDLYLGHKRVKQHIPTIEAVDQLIELIKSEGKWQDPANG